MSTMSNAKRLVAGIFLVVTLNMGAGVSFAAPHEINCSDIKPAQTVALDCSRLTVGQGSQEEINVREARLNYLEISRGFTIRPIFKRSRDDIQNIIERAARWTGLKPSLVRAVAQAESGGNPNAVSPAGAIGVMQLMPETARAMGVNPYNLEQNILGGAQYLRNQVDRFGGNIPKALAAYNAGPGAVEKYGGVPPYEETRNYVARVMFLMGD